MLHRISSASSASFGLAGLAGSALNTCSARTPQTSSSALSGSTTSCSLTRRPTSAAANVYRMGMPASSSDMHTPLSALRLRLLHHDADEQTGMPVRLHCGFDDLPYDTCPLLSFGPGHAHEGVVDNIYCRTVDTFPGRTDGHRTNTATVTAEPPCTNRADLSARLKSCCSHDKGLSDIRALSSVVAWAAIEAVLSELYFSVVEANCRPRCFALFSNVRRLRGNGYAFEHVRMSPYTKKHQS